MLPHKSEANKDHPIAAYAIHCVERSSRKKFKVLIVHVSGIPSIYRTQYRLRLKKQVFLKRASLGCYEAEKQFYNGEF